MSDQYFRIFNLSSSFKFAFALIRAKTCFWIGTPLLWLIRRKVLVGTIFINLSVLYRTRRGKSIAWKGKRAQNANYCYPKVLTVYYSWISEVASHIVPYSVPWWYYTTSLLFLFFLEQKVKKKNQTLYHVTDFDNMNMNIVYTYIEIQARERGPLVHWWGGQSPRGSTGITHRPLQRLYNAHVTVVRTTTSDLVWVGWKTAATGANCLISSRRTRPWWFFNKGQESSFRK